MVNSIVNIFQSFRTILCVCPCCGDILRLADLTLKYKGKTSKTWLDTYDTKARSVDEKVQEFEEKEKEIRDKATERGRSQVPIIIRKSMSSEFTSFRYNPYDIKALLHPVDFVVFNGMTEKDTVDDIVFLSKKHDDPTLQKLRQSIASTIDNGKYSWQVARVDIDGKIEYGEK
jgi:predicted Holliday junction resolvase-like endonuclease